MKGLLKFITCGSVDDGKSTLIGHILYSSKLLYADQERALLLDSRIGSREGAIDYSLLLDGLMAEREQGITIDVAYRYFTTNHRSFIVADTPGHEEYTRNMAVGASFADLSVILIDATQGVLIQTKRHARICSLMGIRHFVFAVNKMDLIGYSAGRFQEIVKEIRSLAQELSLEDIKLIPISATEGDNLIDSSPYMPWYQEEPLLTWLEKVDVTNTNEVGFYMPIQRVCRPNHTFRGFQGQIEAGDIRIGDEIIVLPSNERALVKSINIGDKAAERAFLGQPVTIVLNREVDVSRGCVLTKAAKLQIANQFSVEILWMDESVLQMNKNYWIKLGTKIILGTVTGIKYKIDINTGDFLPAKKLTKNEIAVCEIELSEKIALDNFSGHKSLGELILIDRITNQTSACGVVTQIAVKESGQSIVFCSDDMRAGGEIFNEWYYDVRNLNIVQQKPALRSYGVGDVVPVEGDSFHYPEDFDILVLRDRTAARIRGCRIEAILSIDEYRYSGVPVTDGRGFLINAESAEDIDRFLKEYDSGLSGNEAEFANRWISFEAYRRVVFI